MDECLHVEESHYQEGFEEGKVYVDQFPGKTRKNLFVSLNECILHPCIVVVLVEREGCWDETKEGSWGSTKVSNSDMNLGSIWDVSPCLKTH